LGDVYQMFFVFFSATILWRTKLFSDQKPDGWSVFSVHPIFSAWPAAAAISASRRLTRLSPMQGGLLRAGCYIDVLLYS